MFFNISCNFFDIKWAVGTIVEAIQAIDVKYSEFKIIQNDVLNVRIHVSTVVFVVKAFPSCACM
mgnify:CR=1 FL=1